MSAEGLRQLKAAALEIHGAGTYDQGSHGFMATGANEVSVRDDGFGQFVGLYEVSINADEPIGWLTVQEVEHILKEDL